MVEQRSRESKKPIILYYHGSPGFFDELHFIWNQLQADYQVVAFNRCGLSKDQIFKEVPGVKCVIGYSFGCYFALKYAALHCIERVILICPYLTVSPKKGQSVMCRIPVFSDMILKIFGNIALDKFIKESCYPEDPCDTFVKHVDKMRNDRRLLKYSILEKEWGLESFNLEEKNALKTYSKVTVVAGDQDIIANWGRHSQFLDSIALSYELHLIKGAGHGLPWTHSSLFEQTVKKILLTYC
ncbi:MAG: alpha/beta hydrolase [Bdellovibrionaceae bacterium]|nr:alpha/beta hydrolase [Pseudobdellovibrionaceae bacterium]MDW8189498.1 alpha/beta hydrolase [Pseudobdellovibrionaceae bacterium]